MEINILYEKNINPVAEIEATIREAAAKIGQMYGEEDAEVSLTFTDNEHIRELNRTYRGKDCATDVLSFALNESDEPEIIGGAPVNVLGDIVLSLPKATEQALEYGHSLKRETVFLFVHGMLHLLGYDHMEETDRLEMEAEQRIIMEQLNVPRN